MWTGLNPDGKPKTCLAVCKPRAEKEEKFKLNPLKASKRKASQQSRPTVTPLQEAASKKKKKKERQKSVSQHG
jgi:hypothetical protein